MSRSQFAMVVKPVTSAIKPTKEDRKEVELRASGMWRIGEVARIAMEELTETYLTGEREARRGFNAGHAIKCSTHQTPESEARYNAATRVYAQGLANIMNSATDAVGRQLREEYR